MSHIGNSLGLNNLTIRGQSLGMNLHVMNLINILKIGKIGLVTKTTTGKIMEEIAMMARIGMPIMPLPIIFLREMSSIEE
jgi:hypothetical protein